jgi:hypothetical protein
MLKLMALQNHSVPHSLEKNRETCKATDNHITEERQQSIPSLPDVLDEVHAETIALTKTSSPTISNVKVAQNDIQPNF